MSPKNRKLSDLVPLEPLFATFEDFVAATPFATVSEAREYCRANKQYEFFGLRKDSVDRYGLRPVGSGAALPVAKDSLPADYKSPRKEAAAKREPVVKGTPRYVELLNMLRTAPVTIDEVIAKWGCSKAAASSLFSDVKNKCGANIVRDGETYSLIRGG